MDGVDFADFLTESVLGLDVFGAFRVQQVVVGDPLQVEVLVAQVVLAAKRTSQFYKNPDNWFFKVKKKISF